MPNEPMTNGFREVSSNWALGIGHWALIYRGVRVTRNSRITLKTGVWILCLLPLAVLGYRAANGNLTANPISFITNWLGIGLSAFSWAAWL